MRCFMDHGAKSIAGRIAANEGSSRDFNRIAAVSRENAVEETNSDFQKIGLDIPFVLDMFSIPSQKGRET